MMPLSNEVEREPESRLFDTSFIPDTPEYWETLSARVGNTVAMQRTSSWIARSRVSWISAASLAFAAALVLTLSERARLAEQSADGLRFALAPTDRVGRSLSARDGPPSVAELLVVMGIDAERAK